MLVHRCTKSMKCTPFSPPTSQYLVFHIVGMLVHRLHEIHEVHAFFSSNFISSLIFSSNFISSLIFKLMACWCIDCTKFMKCTPFSLPTSQYLVFHIVSMLAHRLHEIHEVHAIFSSNFISSLIF
jgi:hypothetical protein